MDKIFGVVYQPDFEHHLRTHLDAGYDNDDPTWYALRNAVYASGCRLYHCTQQSASFSSIQAEAWSYFSNALSVHSDLLLRRPTLHAVRALLAMVRSINRRARHHTKYIVSVNFCRGTWESGPRIGLDSKCGSSSTVPGPSSNCPKCQLSDGLRNSATQLVVLGSLLLREEYRRTRWPTFGKRLPSSNG